jgi:mannose-6-phosphate isomerase-like protein (cupin superfamily)
MTTRPPLDTLLDRTREWHAALPALRDFAPWPSDLRYTARAPNPLPHIPGMTADPGEANGLSTALRDALLAAAPHVEWRHTYTEDEVGARFLDTYGWFELAGPTGHYLSDQARITVGFWGQDLFYPRHQHAPEELYSVVSGRAIFHADGEEDREIGPGGTRFHAANQPHAMTTTDSPVLTLVLWRGEGLGDNPGLSRCNSRA